MWKVICQEISRASGEQFDFVDARSVGGGCINEAYQLRSQGGTVFVKLNQATAWDMFEAEAEGLRELAATKTIRVPEPICHGVSDDRAFLVLEYIEMGGRGSEIERGRQLAQLHRHTGGRFGWKRKNTIGSTPQVNMLQDDWVTFLRKHRLGYQLDLAMHNGLRIRGGGELLDRLKSFFNGYTPIPSLLHGDLWSGNMDYSVDGEPVIFDPATYFGDREAEFGLAEMFGGFGRAFYQGYGEVWPLDTGYQTRKELYRLYHTINHYNLFGGGYGSSAQGIVDRLLSQA